MFEEEVKFKTSRGLKLSGTIIAGANILQDIVIFAHGTGSSKMSPRNRAVAERLITYGIASFLIDFTGHGDSDGIFEQSTQDQQFDDIISAMDFLDSQTFVKTRYIGIHGSSTGGTVAIRAAAEDERIQAMVLRVPRNIDILQYAALVTASTLIIQGSEDKIVLPEAIEIFDALKCRKELKIVEGAGHLFAEKPEYLEEIIAGASKWFVDCFCKLAEEE